MNHGMTLRLLLLACLCCGFGQALASNLASALDNTIDLAAVSKQANLSGQLWLLEDPGSKLQPQQALAQAGWQVATPALLNRGSSASAFWLRLDVSNQSPEAITRWLSVGSARIELIDFHRTAQSPGPISQTWLAGAGRPLTGAPILAKTAVFPVRLSAGEAATLLLRVAGRSTLMMEVGLWDPLAFREQEALQDLEHLLPITAMLTVALYLLAYSLARRSLVFVLLAFWLFGAAAYELAFNGYLHRYLLTQGGELLVRAPLLIGNLTIAASMAFTYIFLGLNQLRFWRLAFPLFIIGSLSIAPIAFVTDLRSVIGLSNLFMLGFYLLWPWAMLAAWRNPLPHARLFILALTGLWLVQAMRVLMLVGLIPSNPFTNENLASIYLLALVLVLLFGVVRRSIEQRHAETSAAAARWQERLAEQQRLEQTVRVRTLALQQAVTAAKEANQAKSDFLARVSHDLRTPLTAIIGYAEMIAGAGRQDAESGRIIRRSALHLLALLNDLIDFARGGIQHHCLAVQPTYTQALLSSIADDAAALARRNHNHFTFEMHTLLPPVVEVDVKHVRQVLDNLLMNAAKFTTDGRIDFEVSAQIAKGAEGAESGETEVPLYDFTFTVRDTGIGIAAKDLPHIFEPFRQVHAGMQRGGLGLGLAIAQQWSERMGGRIEVQSCVGQGTTMRVFLTLQAADEDALSYSQQITHEGLAPSLDGANCLIWVVEDSQVIRTMLCTELAALGFRVAALADGKDAIAHIARLDEAAPDLILTDLQMPHADGCAVLQNARLRWPEIPVVLMTADCDPEVARGQSFSQLLAKPLSQSQLRQTLAQLLGLPITHHQNTPPEPISRPTANLLAQAQLLIQMGAISDLLDWSASVADQHPDWLAFALRLKACIERGDLQEAAALCSADSADA